MTMMLHNKKSILQRKENNAFKGSIYRFQREHDVGWSRRVEESYNNNKWDKEREGERRNEGLVNFTMVPFWSVDDQQFQNVENLSIQVQKKKISTQFSSQRTSHLSPKFNVFSLYL